MRTAVTEICNDDSTPLVRKPWVFIRDEYVSLVYVAINDANRVACVLYSQKRFAQRKNEAESGTAVHGEIVE